MTPLGGSGGRAWRRFSRSSFSIVGLVLCCAVVIVALFAPWIAPYPRHAGAFVDFENASRPPDGLYLFGTDVVGRDILSRVMFGYRVSLQIGVIVIAIAAPIGVGLELAAGYFGGWIETIIMRVTDVFLSVPPLVLALAILGVFAPTLTNSVIAISVMWWPWYTRLAYNLTRSLRSEGYVVAAQVVGASTPHILFREILPNCMPSFLTKATLDLQFVVLIAASLGFLGLGAQPPVPELGSMVADGAKNLPDYWWMSVFPGLGILAAVLGFNLLGDGLKDLLDVEI